MKLKLWLSKHYSGDSNSLAINKINYIEQVRILGFFYTCLHVVCKKTLAHEYEKQAKVNNNTINRNADSANDITTL